MSVLGNFGEELEAVLDYFNTTLVSVLAYKSTPTTIKDFHFNTTLVSVLVLALTHTPLKILNFNTTLVSVLASIF